MRSILFVGLVAVAARLGAPVRLVPPPSAPTIEALADSILARFTRGDTTAFDAVYPFLRAGRCSAPRLPIRFRWSLPVPKWCDGGGIGRSW